MSHYKELVLWQRAMELAEAVYNVTDTFPTNERFGLVTQLRRAAVSVPSNIAEGQGRSTPGEFRQFLGHARGSLYEVETQCLLSQRLKMIDDNQQAKIEELIADVGKLLHGLLRSLN